MGPKQLKAQMDLTWPLSNHFTRSKCHLEAKAKDGTRGTQQIYDPIISIICVFHPLDLHSTRPLAHSLYNPLLFEI